MISYKSLIGAQIRDWIPQIADLRITVFREWPYLYDGSIEYELRYLERYASAQRSFVTLAIDGDTVIGASSALWLPEESEASIRKPFEEAAFDFEKVVYFGESIVRKEWRGRGIGTRFMRAREQFAIEHCGAEYVSFCAVVRPEHHALRPASDYRPLDEFWRRQGFERREGMLCYFSWQDIGEGEESPKPLQFWVKRIAR